MSRLPQYRPKPIPTSVVRSGKVTVKRSIVQLPKKDEIDLPAFSRGPKPPPAETDLDRMKKKMIRRNAPAGEDMKNIKAIIKRLVGKEISVEEFVGLVSPYTGDAGNVVPIICANLRSSSTITGAILRQVMLDDMASFKKLATKVYDTLTQNNGDVLANQHVQLYEYYKDRDQIYKTKIIRALEQIYEMAAGFSFEKYAKDRKQHLNELFPTPNIVQIEPEELDMLKRQQAYHRLQWLRTEGDRLGAENAQLQAHLNGLKAAYKQEQRQLAEMENTLEQERYDLEEKQAAMQDEVETLTESLERNIVAQERNLRHETDQSRASPSGPARPKRPKRAEAPARGSTWGELTAARIETQTIEETIEAEVRQVDVKSKKLRKQLARPKAGFRYAPPKSLQRQPDPSGKMVEIRTVEQSTSKIF